MASRPSLGALWDRQIARDCYSQAPFAGSGTTCIAAGLEGFDYLGCEKDQEYVQIAEARLAYWMAQERPAEQMSLVESHA